MARVVRGSVPFVLECRPRFDYGRADPKLVLPDERSAILQGPTEDLCVQATARWSCGPAAQGGAGEPPQIMYRIDGDPHLTEEVLARWEGYAGARRQRRRRPAPARRLVPTSAGHRRR